MFTADLLERAAKTWLQAFVVAFALAMAATMVHGIQFSVAWWEAAAIAAFGAGAAAGASAVTSLVSKPFGVKGTASILPVPAIDVPSTILSTVVSSSPLVSLADQGIDPALGVSGEPDKNANATQNQ